MDFEVCKLFVFIIQLVGSGRFTSKTVASGQSLKTVERRRNNQRVHKFGKPMQL